MFKGAMLLLLLWLTSCACFGNDTAATLTAENILFINTPYTNGTTVNIFKNNIKDDDYLSLNCNLQNKKYQINLSLLTNTD